MYIMWGHERMYSRADEILISRVKILELNV